MILFIKFLIIIQGIGWIIDIEVVNRIKCFKYYDSVNRGGFQKFKSYLGYSFLDKKKLIQSYL